MVSAIVTRTRVWVGPEARRAYEAGSWPPRSVPGGVASKNGIGLQVTCAVITWIMTSVTFAMMFIRPDVARTAARPLLNGLATAGNVMTNTVLQKAVEQASEEVKTGGGLGYALSQSKQFPKLALQMISVGEESGELDAMLMKVADTFDVEVKNTLDRLLAALVPATTIVMTVIVAMIMLAIVLPIMNIAGAVH
jgi:type II secretory pathway component PulF